MGIASLRDLAAIESVDPEDVRGSVVAVDALNWLYRYLTITVKYTDDAVYTTAAGEEVPNLVGIVQGLPRFFEHGIVPVFVFDGGVIDLKRAEMDAREERRMEAAERAAEAREAGDQAEAARYAARAQELTDVIFRTTREVLDLFDVTTVDAPLEGEAQAAHMARVGDADYVGSEDYDSLLFGAPRTLRKLTTRGDPELMDLEATLSAHDITHAQLVDVAILMGTDYNDGLDGYGPKTALSAIQEEGDLKGVLDDEGAEISNADRIRSLYLDPEVTDEYRIDARVDPDLEAVKAYVTEEWEVQASTLDRAFERLEASTPLEV
ncbi:MAG: flap endonuclease-1 [Haloarculaceae archaeon]